MKFKIGYRTIKTAVGTSLAIIIAQFFHLEFLYQLELSPFCAFKIQRKIVAKCKRSFYCLFFIHSVFVYIL